MKMLMLGMAQGNLLCGESSTDDITDYKNKNWLQFLLIVKAAVLKQQISKFYPQIQRTEASDYIYFSQRPFLNVKAIFCA